MLQCRLGKRLALLVTPELHAGPRVTVASPLRSGLTHTPARVDAQEQKRKEPTGWWVSARARGCVVGQHLDANRSRFYHVGQSVWKAFEFGRIRWGKSFSGFSSCPVA